VVNDVLGHRDGLVTQLLLSFADVAGGLRLVCASPGQEIPKLEEVKIDFRLCARFGKPFVE
jgi:hypothetical protein